MNDNEMRCDWMTEAIVEVWANFKRYTEATTLLEQAHYLTELSNSVSDLVSYHPNYNINTGEIEGVFE